jgi:hypothetical protein
VCVDRANGQSSCSAHGACNNPVPVTDISNQASVNVWKDSYGYSWTLTSSGGDVSGSVSVPNPGCSTITYTVSGSISPSSQTDGTEGYTSFTWNASSPSPSSSCGDFSPPIPFTYTGTIQNDGNDYANASWSDDDGSGSATVSKSPSDIPASETTNAVGFSTGEYASLGQFRQTLNATSGSTDIFQGRQVSEYTGFGTSYDNCWYTGSPYAKVTAVTGSEWNVGYYSVDPPDITSVNEWVDDYIGFIPDAVTWYQSYYSGSDNSPYCGYRTPQAMYIATDGTSGSSENYTSDEIGQDIYSNQITSYRNGVSQSESWPR